jgi:hypothetical protein
MASITAAHALRVNRDQLLSVGSLSISHSSESRSDFNALAKGPMLFAP